MLRRYIQNIGIWLRGFGPRWQYVKQNPRNWYAWVLLIPYHGIDVFVNTLTGGDPRVSISLRAQRDRNQSWLARAIRWIADRIFHRKGVQELPMGDDTDDNRELSGPWQLGVSVFWLLVVWGAISAWRLR